MAGEGALPPLTLGFDLDLSGPLAQAKRGRQQIEQEMKGVEGAATKAEVGFRRMGDGADGAAKMAARGMKAVAMGLGAASAAAAGAEKSFVSMGASLLMSFAAGGPVGLGIAAAGAAIGLLAGNTKAAGDAAGKAKADYKAWLDGVTRGAKEAQDAVVSLERERWAIRRRMAGDADASPELKEIMDREAAAQADVLRLQPRARETERMIRAGVPGWSEADLADYKKAVARVAAIQNELYTFMQRNVEKSAENTANGLKREAAALEEHYKKQRLIRALAGMDDLPGKKAAIPGVTPSGWEDDVRTQHERMLFGQEFVRTQERAAQLAAAATDTERERLQLRFDIEDALEAGVMLAEDEAEALAKGTRAIEARAGARRRSEEERAAKEAVERAQREAEARDKATVAAREDLALRRTAIGQEREILKIDQEIAHLRATTNLTEAELGEMRSRMIAELKPATNGMLDAFRSDFGPFITSTFSDAIYEGFVHGFKNADDLAKGFFENLARAASQSLANLAMQGLAGLFGGLAGGGASTMTSSGVGGFVSTLVGAFSGGGGGGNGLDFITGGGGGTDYIGGGMAAADP